MPRIFTLATCCASLLSFVALGAPTTVLAAEPAYDAKLARSVGADERGMKNYVVVVLKAGPARVPAGAERDEMLKGHFANVDRLASEGKIVLAGPCLDGVDGWRGLFVFAASDIDEAKRHLETDPLIMKGEMIAEYHKYYGSAALMLVNDWHKRLVQK